MLTVVEGNPDKYEVGNSSEDIRTLWNVIHQLENLCVGQRPFDVFLERIRSGGELNRHCYNKVFLDIYSKALDHLISQNVLEIRKKQSSSNQMVPLVGLICLLITMSNGTLHDKPLLRNLQQMAAIAPVIQIYSGLGILSLQWILDCTQCQQVRLMLKSHASELRYHLRDMVSETAGAIQLQSLEVSAWMGQFQRWAAGGPRRFIQQTLERLSTSLVEGLNRCEHLRLVVCTSFLFHTLSGRSMPETHLLDICTLLNALKQMENMIEKDWTRVMEAIPHIHNLQRRKLQELADSAMSLIQGIVDPKNPANKIFGKGRRWAEKLKEDIQLVGLLKSLSQNSGPLTSAHVNLMTLTIEIIASSGQVTGDVLKSMSQCVTEMEILVSFDAYFQSATSTRFLYYWRTQLPQALRCLVRGPHLAAKLPAVVQAFTQGIRMLDHCPDEGKASHGFQNQVFELVRKEVLVEVSRAVESTLRLAAFDEQTNTSNDEIPKSNLVSLLWSKPIRIGSRNVNIHEFVGQHLSSICYAYASFASPSSYFTYVEIAALAQQKYGIEVKPPFSVTHMDGLHLDLGELVIAFEAFMSGYCYNLGTGQFVESIGGITSPSLNHTTINVLGPTEMTHGILQHGLGVSQKLLDKSHKHVQQMFDVLLDDMQDFEALQLRLQQERQMLDRHQNIITLESAEALCKDLGNLIMDIPQQNGGQLESGEHLEHEDSGMDDELEIEVRQTTVSMLDEIRSLVTEIGNALGMMRLVRHGTFQCINQNNNALTSAGGYENDIAKLGFSDHALNAANTLDDLCISMQQLDLGKPFEKTIMELSNQFELRGELSTELFYIMVPPLILCHVKDMLEAKHELGVRSTKQKFKGTSDDGFLLGIAFLLKIFQQETLFDELQFFQKVEGEFTDLIHEMNSSLGVSQPGKIQRLLHSIPENMQLVLSPQSQESRKDFLTKKAKGRLEEFRVVRDVLRFGRTILTCT
eukprot:TRINITY_DN4782_c0_g1_i4.p1 TRINITY_DN4782_c0_g1~~TRINITY_DN4782_c0_g1_i4.p1  ORF type:complete len:990 (-),score=112.90 TRINITY_DN4782_c0_g1_i4:438-3359(-)